MTQKTPANRAIGHVLFEADGSARVTVRAIRANQLVGTWTIPEQRLAEDANAPVGVRTDRIDRALSQFEANTRWHVVSAPRQEHPQHYTVDLVRP